MRTVALLVVLAMVLAACGGDSEADEPSTSEGAVTSPTVETSDENESPDTTEEASEEAESGGLQIPVENSCELADARMVEAAFGGSVAPGVEDESYACAFEISDGPVESVRVREAGPASSFEGVRSGYHDNFQGSFDVPGLGDEAFYPGLMGPLLLVVSANGQVFVVDAHSSFSEAGPGSEEAVAQLARAIVDRLEG